MKVLYTTPLNAQQQQFQQQVQSQVLRFSVCAAVRP